MEFITIVIYTSIYIGLVATAFYILTFIADIKREREFFTEDELPKVSVIIPAYNEEKTIQLTIDSILESDYPKDKLDILIVDDGSSDKTYERASEYENKGIRIFKQEVNGGKGKALNKGIKESKGDFIFTMDADTIVDKKSLKTMTRYFKNPEVMSVTPAMVTREAKTIMQRIQSVEYLTGLFLRKTDQFDVCFASPYVRTMQTAEAIISQLGYDLRMFKDSEEGCVPRKKIRVRSYSKGRHTKGDTSLEIKTSSVEGRYKTSTKSFNLKKAIAIGILDSDYGICKPKVRVTYRRAYYKVHNVRLTIDQDIKYGKINSDGQSIYINTDTDIIVEIKANQQVPIEYLFKMFPFERVRFSKYSRAINYCLSGNLNNSINLVNK